MNHLPARTQGTITGGSYERCDLSEGMATSMGEPAMAEWQPASAQWRKQFRWSENPGIGVFGGLIVAIVALLVVIALWVAQRQSQLEVPALVGLSRVEAEALLKNAGLNLGATFDEPSDRPAGTVLRTDPAMGKELDPGARVSLVLAIPPSAPAASDVVEPIPAQQSTPAQEPAPVVVPRVVVAPPVIVRSPIVVRPPVVAPPAVVVPPPVMAPPPVVAPPPAPALRQVPQVVGLHLWRAARTLADDGLSVGSVREQESDKQAGTVLWTNPGAGAAVRPGSSVDLVIAKRRNVEVPDVAGLDRWRAARALADDGLSVGSVLEEESDKQAGTVLRTNPRAGTTVRSGSAVGLVIAKAPARKDPAPKDPKRKDPKDPEPKDSEPGYPAPKKVSGLDAREAKNSGSAAHPAAT